MLGALLVLSGGCGPVATSGTATATEGKAAPEIMLPLQKGAAPVALSHWKGKVVVIDFWATWCGPCRDSIPELERVYQKYHAKGLEVVGISTDAPADTAKVPEAVKSLGMTYPVALAADIPDIDAKYPLEGIPQMYLIDKKGNISQAITGYGPGINLDAKVEALLNEKI
jgi:thiol-disulfide isomerase/thioredoxin